jgi:TolB-like protein/tetratricopeptide (TPR) repeat protein
LRFGRRRPSFSGVLEPMTNKATSLLPRDWDALAPLVDRLLDTPADQRAALFAEISGGDPGRRAQLEQLVAECEREMPLLDRPAVEGFDRLVAEEPGPPLPDVLGGRYRIERELGRGGMAHVHLAQDLKHSRPVAVKVIRPELAASLGRERFLREIGIAARLRHPSIIPLFDSGDADGLLYFVMPYEAGLSLRARLQRDGRLGTADAVSILRDVARALAYAHEHGVVHRDVKPDNVLLSGDAAVVTDFGIAKAFSVALTGTGTDTLAQADGVIGTPAYMAPEQGRGDPTTDHRADLYSFGCLAYEVFTGEPPFAGSTTLELIKAHETVAPPPIVEGRSDVPAPIARLIARCLEKDPAARPQSAGELLEVLAAIPTPDRAVVTGRRKLVRRALVVSAAVAVTLVAWYVGTRGAGEGPVTVAVLPIANVGGDSAQAIFAEGLSDDLATALVRLPWVRVRSRQGASNYSGKGDIDPRIAGKALGARYLVTGSLHQINGRQTFTTQLVSTADASVLWADKFDEPAELSALGDQIVATIGDSLRPKAGRFSSPGSGTLPARYRPNVDARISYILGNRELTQRNQNLASGVAHFRQAVSHDSLWADAWSGLSLALALSPNYRGASADSVRPEVIATARRALQLDPKLAKPHIALGLVLARNLEWGPAEAELKAAVDIDPHDVEARTQYGRLLIFRSRLGDGHRELEMAREDDPASAPVLSLLSFSWYLRGQLDSALVESDRAMQSNRFNLTTICFRSMILIALGQKEEARRILRPLPPYIPMVLYALAAAGDTATVMARLRAIPSNPTRASTPTPETARAFSMLGIGDTTQALAALERATAAREIWPALFPTSSPMFDSIRGSPRFDSLLARVGLAGK